MRRKGFTLVELLVVIGIIAVLIGILLPALNKARKAADTAKCLATMRQFAACFQMYASENNGYYPMSVLYYPAPPDGPGTATDMTNTTSGTRKLNRRWPDFLGKYWNNGRLVNPDGTGTQDAAKTYDTVASIMASGKNSIIWGCPAWQQNQRTYYLQANPNYRVNTTTSTTHNGYAMNIYPAAPNPVAKMANGFYNWPYRSATDLGTASQAGGWFVKATAYTRPGERCLLAENAHRDMSVSTLQPWWSDSNGNGMSGWTNLPPVPDIFIMTLDWNRHGRKPIGNGPNDPGMNVVYCDGHAATVSLSEAIRSVRFIDPKMSN